MARKKTIIPTDLRDFLSIISFIGFLAIFLKFTLEKPFLSASMDALFLIIAGSGLMVIGKVFTIRKWMSDGIQSNEGTQLLSIVVGLSSIVIGFMLLFEVTIPFNITGFIGILALFPMMFILFDYMTKNSKC